MWITNWALKQAVTVYVLIVLIAITGWGAYQSMARESFPDVEIPFVMISTIYVGVSSQDIETLVTRPIEDELERLRDVRRISSTSMDSASVIVVEFEPSVQMDVALQRTRDRVEAAKPELPTEAEDPDVFEISISDLPVVLISISGDIGIARLTQVAENLQEELDRIPGVLDTNVRGGVERQILVEADARELDAFGISLNEIISSIQDENINIPGGSMDLGRLRYTVRTPGEVEDWTELEDLVVRSVEEQDILLRQVANVRDGYRDRETYSRINGTESVTIDVSRRGGANILELIDNIKSLVERHQGRYGEVITFTILNDTSENVRTNIRDLENNILTGLILVASLLLFFMGGFRNALFVAISIPMSMLLTFIVLAASGVTLNIVTLFSLILALGLLVDNGIVVVENIYRNANMGKDLKTAARDGVAQVGLPVIASTATTVAAFFPMLFWPGIMGRFMFYLPMTVIVVLCSSLFTALVILPVLCSRFMTVKRTGAPSGHTPEDELAALPNNPLYRLYGSSLRTALRFRWIVLLAVIGLFVGTLALFKENNAGVVFGPDTTPETLIINLSLPDGSNLEASDELLRGVDNYLAQEQGIVNWVSEVGAGLAGDMFGGSGNSPHQSRITIDLHKAEQQEENPRLLMQRIRAHLLRYEDLTFEVMAEQMGPPTGDPIAVEVSGENYAEVGAFAQVFAEHIRGLEGTTDITTDFESGRSDITIRVNRRLASQVGARTGDIAFTVRAAVTGVEATRFREGGDEYDIVVRMAQPFRSSIEDLHNLYLTTRTGQRVRLGDVADIALTPGTGAIKRAHLRPVVLISGDVEDGANAEEVRGRIATLAEEGMQLPPGIQVSFTGEAEDQEETAAFLGMAMSVALMLILLILITQFNSVLQPIIIMTTVVLSIIGILWQLMIFQEPFVILMTGMAVISLAGVVVNNSIVLTEFTNMYRRQGLGLMDAAWQAGMVRLRPVLLSAFTTSSSLVPTVLGFNLNFRELRLDSGGTSVEFWGPMAKAIVVGLLFSAFLTLIVVPVLYVVLEGMKASLTNLLERIQGRATDSDPSAVLDD